MSTYTLFLPGRRSKLIDFSIDCEDVVYFPNGKRNSSFIIKKGETKEGFDGAQDIEKNLLTALITIYSGFRFHFSSGEDSYHLKKEIIDFDLKKRLNEVKKAPIGYSLSEAKAVNFTNFFWPFASMIKIHPEIIKKPYIPTHSTGFVSSKNNSELRKQVKTAYRSIGINNIFINSICSYVNKAIDLFYQGHYQETGLNLALIQEIIVLYFKAEHLHGKKKIKSLKQVRSVDYKDVEKEIEKKLKLNKYLMHELKIHRDVRNKIIAHPDLLITEGGGAHWGAADFLYVEHVPAINEILIKFIDYVLKNKKYDLLESMHKLEDLVKF